jgi:hypothetical protein
MANIHKRRLHTRQNANDFSFIDVADNAFVSIPFEEELEDFFVFQQRYTRLLGIGIDKNFFGHGKPFLVCAMDASAQRHLRAIDLVGRGKTELDEPFFQNQPQQHQKIHREMSGRPDHSSRDRFGRLVLTFSNSERTLT